MNIIEMKDIVKTFPGVVANDHVNLNVKEGEIHALLGENGAGKTTLMNVLYGLYSMDEGEIYLRGEKVELNGPEDAIEHGIGMVHQHFMLVPPLTVAENIVLGAEPNKGFDFDEKMAIEKVEEISEQYGLHVEADSLVQDVSVGMCQRAEILKILYRGAEVLIFDEPTAVLTPQEIDYLYEVMAGLREKGHTIILITHKLNEVKKISDRVTVIRKGKNVDTVKTAETDQKTLAEMMVGREVVLQIEKPPQDRGECILKADDIYVNDYRGLPAVKGCSLKIHEGEILGVAGVEGNGQAELVEMLMGLRECAQGEIWFKDEKVNMPFTTKEIIRKGIGHIPEDRQKRGLVLEFSVKENILLGSEDDKKFTKGPFLDYESINKYALELVEEYDIRTPGIETTAGGLSGGNQQKLVVARELGRCPGLLIASQPSRGLDVGAIEFVHEKLLEERNRGRGILLVSYELDELLSLSDRIIVMYDGEINAEFENADVSKEELGYWMGGGEEVPEK